MGVLARRAIPSMTTLAVPYDPHGDQDARTEQRQRGLAETVAGDQRVGYDEHGDRDDAHPLSSESSHMRLAGQLKTK
jgi:hypothetical protein